MRLRRPTAICTPAISTLGGPIGLEWLERAEFGRRNGPLSSDRGRAPAAGPCLGNIDDSLSNDTSGRRYREKFWGRAKKRASEVEQTVVGVGGKGI